MSVFRDDKDAMVDARLWRLSGGSCMRNDATNGSLCESSTTPFSDGWLSMGIESSSVSTFSNRGKGDSSSAMVGRFH